MLKPLFQLLPLLAFAFSCACHSTPKTDNSGKIRLYVGTYTQKLGHVDGKASGIYSALFDPKTGDLVLTDSTTEIANPSYLTLSPDKKTLYAVGENGGKANQPFGSVAAYRVGSEGRLTKINEVPSYGVAPCHISTDASGHFVFVANYASGSVLSYGVKSDGGLTDSLCRRTHSGPHPWAHQVYPSPDKRHLWAVDKGTDEVFAYEIGAKGELTLRSTLSLPKNAGPRHLDFYPGNPNLLAVVNELSNSVFSFRFDPISGKCTVLDSLTTLPTGFNDQNYCADLHFHPNGKFLYASNRGHNSIAVFEINPENGKLTGIEQTSTHGEFPRSFWISPDGAWLLAANQNTNNVAAFRIDPQTGKLAFVKENKILTPVCLKN